MKAKFTFVILVIVGFLYTNCEAQMFVGDLTLPTQAHVDAFFFTQVTGSLTIGGTASNFSDITNLEGLESLTSVGYLRIQHTDNLTNLDGLQNLTSTNSLYFYNNSALTNVDSLLNLTGVLTIYFHTNPLLENVDGLGNITNIPGHLLLTKNHSLTDLSAFKNLTNIGYHLKIDQNNSLTSLNGLQNLTTIGGQLFLNYNESLTSIDSLHKLETVGGWLYIEGNDAMSNLNGLQNLTTVGHDVHIRSLDGITNIDSLHNLTTVGEDLAIYNNPMMTNINGLKNLTTVGGQIQINDIELLTNLDGLRSLETVGGNLIFHSLNGLTNTDSLHNLTAVGGHLRFAYNWGQFNLKGLHNLTSVGGDLWIYSTVGLSSLDGLDNLVTVGGDVKIYHNFELTSFCSLFSLMDGGGFNGNYIAYTNGEASSKQQILNDGPCPCNIAINSITVSDEGCPGLSDGSITVNASCTSCIGMEYSIGGDFQEENVFTNVGPGSYTITVRDIDDYTCSDNIDTDINPGIDSEAPVLTVNPAPITLWPPNHKYKSFDLDDFVISVSDNCSDLSLDDVVIVSATSDEPENGSGDGNTTDDMVIGDDCQYVKLRKERKGNGNGRVYTIYFEVEDEAGNLGTASAQVHVPHSNNGTAIDDGVAYEVTGDCEAYKSSFLADNGTDQNQIENYPNPFSNKTNIDFTVSETGTFSLKVYNSMGHHVATLYDGTAESGQQYSVEFDGSSLTKGVYFYHLLSNKGVNVTKKMILVE